MKGRELYDWVQDELSTVYPPEEAGAMARILLEEVMGLPFHVILVDPEAQQEPSATLLTALSQLKKHRPLQYVLGRTDFAGLNFRVDERVLVPRPETEELVRWIVDENRLKTPAILDVGTGSGAIAVSLARAIPGAEVSGWDVSLEALEIAMENAEANGVLVRFRQTDVLTEKPSEKYDLIVSNPPYVRESERMVMRANVLDYEPACALFVPDDDPLLFYRKITELATLSLQDGGWLYFEINEAYGPEIVNLLKSNGFSGVELRRDIFDRDRMVRAQWK